jgi:formate dehydrogenase subunit delta
MANQIGKFFAAQGEDKAVPLIADHLVKFWDPRMRREILAHLADGGAGMDPLVRRGVELLPREVDVSSPMTVARR